MGILPVETPSITGSSEWILQTQLQKGEDLSMQSGLPLPKVLSEHVLAAVPPVTHQRREFSRKAVVTFHLGVLSGLSNS